MYDLDEDQLTLVRELEFNGRKFKIFPTNPRGHWRVEAPKGPVPEELSGEYTSGSLASKAVEIWSNQNPLKLGYHDAVAAEEAKNPELKLPPKPIVKMGPKPKETKTVDNDGSVTTITSGVEVLKATKV